jgi:hypothetical protein
MEPCINRICSAVFLRYCCAISPEPAAGGSDGAGDPCRLAVMRAGGALADEPAAVGINFGRSEAVLKRLEAEFVGWFRHHVTAFPVVHARLTAYLTSTDCRRLADHRSPQSLVEQVYRDTALAAAGESDRQPQWRAAGAAGY